MTQSNVSMATNTPYIYGQRELPKLVTPTAMEIAEATKPALIGWLRWNDKNGEYTAAMSKALLVAHVISQCSDGAIAFSRS